jgi:hypothetical protein
MVSLSFLHSPVYSQTYLHKNLSMYDPLRQHGALSSHHLYTLMAWFIGIQIYFLPSGILHKMLLVDCQHFIIIII